MLVWKIVLFILICVHLFYIDYLFYELLYKVSIDKIIAYRKTRLVKIKASNELRIFELEEKNKEKFNSKIEKLKDANVKIVAKLLELENYSTIKKD